MSDWIDINLPWAYYSRSELETDYPKAPDFTKKIKKEFGTTANVEHDKITRQEFDRYGTARTQFAQKFGALSTDEFLEKIAEEHPSIPAVQKVVAYHQLRRKIDQWQVQQPEFIAWRRAVDEWNHKEEQKSFCGRKLNQPGTLVEVRDDEGVKQYLIGEINTNAGVCDDCTAFGNNAQVLRYKVIWTAA